MHNRSLTAATTVRDRTEGGRSRRRVVAVMVGALLTLGMLAAPAAADDDHPHGLFLHVEVVDGIPTYARCVDLANGRALPDHVHHETVHVGTAGSALQRAGHAVAPYNCP